jgi:hypothetical protein
MHKVLLSSYCLCVMFVQCWTISEVVVTYKMKKWCTIQLSIFEGLKTVGMAHKLSLHVRGTSAVFGTYTSLVLRIKNYCSCEGEGNHFTILLGALRLTFVRTRCEKHIIFSPATVLLLRTTDFVISISSLLETFTITKVSNQ